MTGPDAREDKIAELRNEVERLRDRTGCSPWKSIALGAGPRGEGKGGAHDGLRAAERLAS